MTNKPAGDCPRHISFTRTLIYVYLLDSASPSSSAYNLHIMRCKAQRNHVKRIQEIFGNDRVKAHRPTKALALSCLNQLAVGLLVLFEQKVQLKPLFKCGFANPMFRIEPGRVL